MLLHPVAGASGTVLRAHTRIPAQGLLCDTTIQSDLRSRPVSASCGKPLRQPVTDRRFIQNSRRSMPPPAPLNQPLPNTSAMPTFTLIFLCALLGNAVLQAWLMQRQKRHVLAHRAAVPTAFASMVTLEQHQKAADYTVAKASLGQFAIVIETVILLALTLGGGIQWLDNNTTALLQSIMRHAAFIQSGHLHWLRHIVTACAGSPLSQGVLLILAYMLVTALLDLPLTIYRTFILETRFGFNTTKAKVFASDQLKVVGLLFAFGTPIITLLIWIFTAMGTHWWLWAWAALTAYQLLMMEIYPIVIAPVFNKFTPLGNAALQERITALLLRCGFSSNGVFVMDGSTRSSHGNAYFVGLGKNKRIVFFDTLLEQLDDAQMEAVLAHELGHFHHGHIRKRMLLMCGFSLVGLWLLAQLQHFAWFYQGLGVWDQSPALALLLFAISLLVFLAPTAPLFNAMSRKDEFEADRFAASHTRADDLVLALVKLYGDNSSTLTPDRLHSAFYDSHPPAPLRIGALQSL